MSSQVGRGAFTLIEMQVAIAIIAVLAAILFPVFARAREKGRQATCLSNLKQIGLALEMYVQDYDETLPYHLISIDMGGTYVNWLSGVEPYCRNARVFECPSLRDDHYEGPTDTTLSYPYNRDLNGRFLGSIEEPSEVIVCLDGVQASCSYSGGDTFRDTDGTVYTEDPNTGTSPNRVIFSRHNGGGNCLFVDGHVKWLRAQRVRDGLRVRSR